MQNESFPRLPTLKCNTPCLRRFGWGNRRQKLLSNPKWKPSPFAGEQWNRVRGVVPARMYD